MQEFAGVTSIETGLDYNGISNTISLCAAMGDSDAYAAGKAVKMLDEAVMFTYLGGTGEWQAVVDHFDEINRGLTKIGGSPLTESSYMCSTQRDLQRCWHCDLSTKNFIGPTKTTLAKVRPFAPIKDHVSDNYTIPVSRYYADGTEAYIISRSNKSWTKYLCICNTELAAANDGSKALTVGPYEVTGLLSFVYVNSDNATYTDILTVIYSN